MVQVDSEEVQKIKTLIRYCEARSAGRTCGARTEDLHFLDLPFYETGSPLHACATCTCSCEPWECYQSCALDNLNAGCTCCHIEPS